MPKYELPITLITDNKDVVTQILIKFTESEQEVSELIESGGVVIETGDEDEAEALAEQLRAAGAEVEIERREPQPKERQEFVVKGAVQSDPPDGDTPLEVIDGIGPDRAKEFRELGFETVADVTDASEAALIQATDVGDVLAERVINTAEGRRIPGVIVRAFDLDLRSEHLLGQATTDRDGRYEITYTANQLQRDEQNSADLLLRAFNPMGKELDVEMESDKAERLESVVAESTTHVIFDADPVETVHLTVQSSAVLNSDL